MTTVEYAVPDLPRVEAFHDLLPPLARALDVRDIFKHLSDVASRIVPHDEANLVLVTEDGSQFRLYASTRDGAPEVVCQKGCPIGNPAEPRLLATVPGPERGLRSGVCAPVRIDDKPVVGVFALFSRRPDAYSPADLVLVQRIADYIAVALAHQDRKS